MANEFENNEMIMEEQNRPEPPKDKNGNPLPPPHGGRPPMHQGERPPEPPKDKDGNPLPPPGDGRSPMHDGKRPPEPPKDENGNPLPPLEDGCPHRPDQEDEGSSESAAGETI